MQQLLKRTPLYEAHRAAGARMAPFGGWEMPIQYSSIIEEHRAVRTAAGLFDVSHMGEIEVEGPQALAVVQRLVTNDVARLAVGQALYTPMCTPTGGIIDDLLVYRLEDRRFMMVVNAANTQGDLAWVREHAGHGAHVLDRTDEIVLLALQGPRAQEILQSLTPIPLDTVKYYWFHARAPIAGRAAMVSRTGYTGEDGFEIYVAAEVGLPLWETLLTSGRKMGMLPAGLGARDTLRLEAGYLLYGTDMDTTTTPYEVGLGWTVKLDKGEFIGAETLRRLRSERLRRRLAGFTLAERAIARHGFTIYKDEAPIGHVTSGTFGPTVGKSIGLGFVPPQHASPGETISVEIRGRRVPGVITKLPFYSRRASRS